LIDDLNTLMPLGMVEAALLTCIRTAAVSGHVLRALTPGIRRVAVLGAGRQAGMHLKMLQALFPDLAEITVWSRSGDVLNRLFPEGKIPPNIRLCETAETAVERADAVLMCTSSPQPILGAAAVRPGLLMLQIGFHEMSFDGIDAFDVVSCDLWGAFSKTSAKSLFQMHRAGRFEQTRVAADLPAILCEGWRPPKGASVYFSSFGLNIFDIALAARLLRHAATMGVGHHLPD
jgi:ornithine cyclodeaminase